MAKTGSGAIANAGKSKGKFVSWDAGLTDSDVAGLEVIADHTDEVIEALGTAMARALEAIGIEAESDAANLCPVDTGRLRNSITHAIDENWAIVGTSTEYAPYVHQGVHGRPGQPFLTDAVTQNADKYRSIAEAALKDA